MLLDLITKDSPSKPYVHENVGTYLLPNKDVKDGVVGKGVSTFQELNFAEKNKNYTSSDFDIANILEVGAFGMLNPTYVSTMSSMEFADSFQNAKLVVNE